VKSKLRPAPKPLDEPDFNRLIVEVMAYVKWVEIGEYHCDPADERMHWIFEEAIKAVYGDQVFDWVNGVIE
jgi:hypothetical protein